MGIPKLIETVNNPTWQSEGACLLSSPELFHPSGTGKKARTERAKEICNTECTVQAKCLAWILEIESQGEASYISGIIGGMTADERRKNKRCRLKGCSEPAPPATTRQVFCSDEHAAESLEQSVERSRLKVTNGYHDGIHHMQGTTHGYM